MEETTVLNQSETKLLKWRFVCVRQKLVIWGCHATVFGFWNKHSSNQGYVSAKVKRSKICVFPMLEHPE